MGVKQRPETREPFLNRNSGERLKPQLVQILFSCGGLGDNLARMPAILALLKEQHHVTVRAFVHDYFVEVMTAFPQLAAFIQLDRLQIYPISSAKQMLNQEQPGFTTSTVEFSPSRMGLIDHAFINICDRLPHAEEYHYLLLPDNGFASKRLLGVGPYVVLCTGFTARVREWPVEEINKTIAGLVQRDLTPVLLGTKKNKTGMASDPAVSATFRAELNVADCVDLREQTSILDAYSVIAGAKAIMGIDNGLLHLAQCVPTLARPEIIAGFTSILSQHRMVTYTGGNTVEAEIDCYGCQSNMHFVYEYDFRFCPYGDYACTKTMTAERFLHKLDKALESRASF
jgi:hypothetical protein